MTRLFGSLVFCLCFVQTYAQSIKQEENRLNEIVRSKDISQLEMKELVSKWREFIKGNSYPELPVDLEGEVEYSGVIVNSTKSKELAYKKIKEWAVLDQGQHIEGILFYEDIDRGKLIISNQSFLDANIDLKSLLGGTKERTGFFKVKYIVVFTVEEETIHIKMHNLNYELADLTLDNQDELEAQVESVARSKLGVLGNFSRNNSYVQYSLSDLYPIVNYDSESWKMRINLLEATKNEFSRLENSVSKYITTVR